MRRLPPRREGVEQGSPIFSVNGVDLPVCAESTIHLAFPAPYAQAPAVALMAAKGLTQNALIMFEVESSIRKTGGIIEAHAGHMTRPRIHLPIKHHTPRARKELLTQDFETGITTYNELVNRFPVPRAKADHSSEHRPLEGVEDIDVLAGQVPTVGAP